MDKPLLSVGDEEINPIHGGKTGGYVPPSAQSMSGGKKSSRPSEEVIQGAGIPMRPSKDTGKGGINTHDEEENGGVDPSTFVISKGLTTAEAEALLLKHGRNELEDKKTPNVRRKKILCFIK